MHAHSSASSSSKNTLDAERADRISRLAGLERVATLRGASAHLAPGGGAYAQQQQPPGYFDNAITPQVKERSTVGSASATGSAGGRTAESDVYDADKMSEDQDDGVSSNAGMSDEGNASLVGFGETASSTVGGPISGRGGAGSRATNVGGGPTTLKQGRHESPSPMQGVQATNPAMLDGISYGRDTVDTTPRGGDARDVSMTGQEQAETIMRDRIDGKEGEGRPMANHDDGKGLGKFYFEGK